jgi:hypothetical protein
MQWVDTLMSLARRSAGTAEMRATVDLDRMLAMLELGRAAAAVADARRAGIWRDSTAVAAALHLGAPPDSARDAAARLARLAAAPPSPNVLARRAQYTAACLTGQWNLLIEPAGSAAGAIAVLRRGVGARDALGRPEANPVCLALLDAMQAVRDERPDRVSVVMALDSLLQTVPPGISGVNIPPDAGLETINLVCARLLERVGFPGPAYRAARRTVWTGFHGAVTPRLRDEGRLAALAGDRDAAVRAYEQYLTVRFDPEASLVPQRDSVRAELAALLAGR